MPKVSIYEYTHYRLFLRDKFQEMKSHNPRFSYRLFNRIAGVSSSAHLKLVMDGERNLGEKMIKKIALGFRLNEDEARFFDHLVRFNQAKTHDEKNEHFKSLIRLKKFVQAKPMEAAQYHLYSNWYYITILEMLRLSTRENKTAEWIHRHMNPKVQMDEVRRAIKELQVLKLIKEDTSGQLHPEEAMLTTPDLVKSIAVANFHIQMSEIAVRAIRKERAENREFSALTLALSEEGFQRAKKEIQDFRKKLHSLLEHENQGPKVVVSEINLQLFNLSLKLPRGTS